MKYSPLLGCYYVTGTSQALLTDILIQGLIIAVQTVFKARSFLTTSHWQNARFFCRLSELCKTANRLLLKRVYL